MKKSVSSIVIFSLCIALIPVIASARPADDCTRVGVYLDRVQARVERAAPLINRSGNERAISLLHQAMGDLRNANSAYDTGRCRAAFRLGQRAESYVNRALRMINRDRID